LMNVPDRRRRLHGQAGLASPIFPWERRLFRVNELRSKRGLVGADLGAADAPALQGNAAGWQVEVRFAEEV